MVNKSITALTDFTYGESGVRVLGTQLEPWFVVSDVLRALDISTKYMARTLERLDNDEKVVAKITAEGGFTPINLMGVVWGDPNTVWLVSEPGLYKIMLRSRTPKAEKFTRFVTHEVLPQIRKYGSYKPNRVRGRQPKLYLNGLVPRDGLVNAAASLGMRVEDARKKSADELEEFCVERGNADWVEANLDKYPYSFSMLNQCVGGFLSLVMLDVPDLEEYVLVPRRNCRPDEWCFTANFADNLETFAKKAKLSKYFDGACLEKRKTYVSAMQNGELCDISTLKLVQYKWEFDVAKYKEADWA